MKIRPLFWRAVSYFRLGYSYYIGFMLTVANFMMIVYYLVMERIPFLKQLFPHFAYFLVILAFLITPLGIALGYLHARKTEAMAADGYISTRANPLAIVPAYIYYKEFLRIEEKLGVQPSEEIRRLYEFYKKEARYQKWQP